MFQALVVTLREGVEAALIVGITLVYLAKVGRSDLRKTVYWALATAVVASVIGAVALSYLPTTQEQLEGWIMLLAAVFVVSMVIFMMRTARKLKGEIEIKVGAFAGAGSKWGLFAFVFLMVFREGVETVVILSGVTLASTELMSFLGTLAGVALAVVFGVMFVKGSVRINLQKFFRITTVILFFVAAQLVISGLHELSEYGVLPSSRQEMALIGPIVRNEMFFVVTILALAALMVLFEVKRREPVPATASLAEQRKATWSARRERFWMASVYASSFLFIVMVTAQFIYEKSVSAVSPASPVTFVNGKVSIPLPQISGGDLHAFTASENGVNIRFWLYQKPDGKVATVFDACQICGPVGFRKGPNGVVCRNCAAPINAQSVGNTGGCNPIPLQATVTSDAVVISEADVAAGSRYFRQQ